ncbi:MAG: helix-hairpin-helix domain-containing protein [Prevotellaceae bacterium]|jgi:competence ComEA-like helix-hairpin-helix protein|nr:helix-hairpin-helix domain-containing protein [Prevotellaceae bacterium]
MLKRLKILISFSKSERVGLAVLLVLLAWFIIWPHLVPPPQSSVMDMDEFKRRIDSLSRLPSLEDDNEPSFTSVYQRKDHYKDYKKYEKPPINYVHFDPNTVDTQVFEQLGFSPKQAVTIVNYRSRGAVFRTPDDFKKVFVVSDEHFERLKPYIRIDTAALPKLLPRARFDSLRYPKREPRIVEINTADTAELRWVNGIGAFTAQQIVSYRKRLGGFARIEQLREIRGMTDERFEQIALQITLDTTSFTRIDLRVADEAILKAHPYIGAYAARGILLFRRMSGAEACTIDALITNNILKKDVAEKLRPYVESATSPSEQVD